jgi:hypothetical protein
MACQACSKVGLDHHEVKDNCKKSLYYMSRVLGGFKDMEQELHGGAVKWLDKHLKNGQRRFWFIWPRGSRKSTLFAAMMPLWKALSNREHTTGVFHESAMMSERCLRVSQNSCLNENFMHYFPELHPGKVPRDWNTEMLSINPGGISPMPTIWARGVDSRVTGGHFDDLVFDDIIGEQSHRSPILVQRAIDFVTYSDPLLISKENGWKVGTGTWWPGGFYEYIKDTGIYKMLILGCYVDDRYLAFMDEIGMKTAKKEGDPIYKYYTLKGLEDSRREMGDYAFSHQMLNLPVSPEMQRFRMEDIEARCFTMDGEYCVAGGERFKWKDMVRTMSCDPATGEHADTDESSIVVCGWVPSRNWAFVLDTWSGRVTGDVLVSKFVSYARKWGLHTVMLESVSGFKILKPFLPHEMGRQNYHFSVEEVSAQSGKKFRIAESLQPFVANRQVWFQQAHVKLIRQMVDFQIIANKLRGKSPNELDALSYHAEKWRFYISDSSKSEWAIDFWSPEEQHDELKDQWGLSCAN